MKQVAVIGGGASGLAAAISAGADNNNSVILFERQQRVARKLLSTGNGRCNLTNTGAAPENYHGGRQDFVRPALEKLPPEKILDFFHGLGLVTQQEYGGRVYPLSNSANSVADVLRFALMKDNIRLCTERGVREIRRRDGGFIVVTDDEEIPAQYVIVACGGPAGGKLGGVKDGYELLKGLGHRRTNLYPSLTQITTDPTYPRALKGVKADARLRLTGAAEGESGGEVLFTEKGVSGPAAFDISRAVSVSGDGKKELHMDFLRGFSPDEAEKMLTARKKAAPELPAEELFTGAVHNRLGRMLVKYAGIPAAKLLNELTDREISGAAKAVKDFTLAVKGTEGFDSAQVTAGGADTAQFDPNTMESRLVPGLFACGEVLDVDGDCGGYNLQWAWASGILAGRLGK